MFCPTCKGLLTRRTVGKRITTYCAKCDGVGTDDAPLAWFAKRAGGPDRASAAAKVAAVARPHIPNADKRARATGPPREPKILPPPDKIEVPPGMDLFPFGSVRDGQREFIADVSQAAMDGKHLLAHAPTGLGKTVSTLAPLMAYALAHDKRIFFLTSKQSQHKIAVETLKAIRDKAGVPFVVSDVISKQDMCPRREARDLFSKRFAEFCHREVVSKSCEYFENKNEGAIKLLKQRPLHVEELVITATDCVVCPHQAALDLAAQAHVVVCDYNYFFSDLRAQMQERLKLDMKDVILVVDEAHNLPDRIRDHLTIRLDEYVLDEALDEAKDLNDELLKRRIEALATVLADLADKTVEAEPGEDLVARGSQRYVSRDELHGAITETFAKRAMTLVATTYDDFLDELSDAIGRYETEYKVDSSGLLKLHQFLSNWKNERRGIARILEREPTPSLRYHVLDPAVLAKPVFDAIHASVVMSGTLFPTQMTRDVLGLDPARCVERVYDSPFPRGNRLVIVDGNVTTGYKDRTPQMYSDIAERLASVALATPGNVAAFFPSYAILEQVRPTVELALRGRKEVIAEERGLDKSEKEGLVEQMRRGLDNALLLGVQSGSLSEGYDYEGNLLKGVVVVGLPFASPTLEVESLINFYEKKFGPGLGRPYAYVHPTFHKVLQAAGRMIRGPTDRGVVVLLDKRFGWGSYRASYPADFSPKPSQDVAADVARFWAMQPR
ncbi:MAG TPA: ATP-dependent DNA helicase [Candidatus Thermoplasmatota archaeon]|nr:ATP-dependent DNA helicase [Candidatus Thermoplasmatota archaeon]